MARPLPIVTALATAVALAVAGCGQSKEEKASSQVCDARADLSKQVSTLAGMTASTASVDQVKKSLEAIGNDLSQIGKAQGDLSDARKEQVKSANAAFASQVEDLASSAAKSLSLSGAGSALQSAAQDLASSYRQTFAKVDCGS